MCTVATVSLLQAVTILHHVEMSAAANDVKIWPVVCTHTTRTHANVFDKVL